MLFSPLTPRSRGEEPGRRYGVEERGTEARDQIAEGRAAPVLNRVDRVGHRHFKVSPGRHHVLAAFERTLEGA